MEPQISFRIVTRPHRHIAAVARSIILLVLMCGWIQLFAADAGAAEPVLSIDTPVSPPAWALLERELLRANTAACREFFEKYFDERGFLICVERWGGDDGPDDAIE